MTFGVLVRVPRGAKSRSVDSALRAVLPLWQVSLALLTHLQVYWSCTHRPGHVCVPSACLGSLNVSHQFPRPSGPAALRLAPPTHHPSLHAHPCSHTPTHQSCMHPHQHALPACSSMAFMHTHNTCLHAYTLTCVDTHTPMPALHQHHYHPLSTHPCLVIDHHHNTVMVSMTHYHTPTPSSGSFFATTPALMTMAAMPSPSVDSCDSPQHAYFILSTP